MEVLNIITQAYDKDIAEKVINSYREIENNFVLSKWKTSELEAGHFVESVRRLVELELFKSYTPFNKQLNIFDDVVLKKYENASGHESFRILIPKSLKSIYTIRNKRGVGHIHEISPNEIDATFILYSSKWILAEIVRLKSSMSIDQTKTLINKIIERKISLIWKTDEFTRVLNHQLPSKEKILILLFDKSPQSLIDLKLSIRYKNGTDFRKIIEELNKEVFIHFDGQICSISPKGANFAEKIMLNHNN